MTPRFPVDPTDDASLPAWMTATLRQPVESAPASRARIMQAVASLPAPRRFHVPHSLRRAGSWRRRGALSGAGGVLLTAMLALMLTVRHGEEFVWRQAMTTQLTVAGDSVVPVAGGDSVVTRLGARFLDTLRIVEIVLRGPRLDRADITIGNAQVQASLVRTSEGAELWQARALVPRDIMALTLVVNGVPHVASIAR